MPDSGQEQVESQVRVWNGANLSDLGRAFFVHCWTVSHLNRLAIPVPQALVDQVHRIDADWDRKAEEPNANGPADEVTRQAQRDVNTDEARGRAALSPADLEHVKAGDWYGGPESDRILFGLAASRFVDADRLVPTFVLERLHQLGPQEPRTAGGS